MKENYLEKKPSLKEGISFEEKNGIITLCIENKGIMNKIAQKLFGKPKLSYIHLDELGSFALALADGKTSILEMGEAVKGKFGEKAEPLYERLAKFFQVMDSYAFIEWKE
ncbi:MAG: PqqD family protein [Ruminococcaceae bacterium]|nr:PqqD family protein [Oscillospiraceae bacterium]